MPIRDPGSFRDPSGSVFIDGGRVIRTVTEHAAANFEALRKSGFLTELIRAGTLLDAEEIPPSSVGFRPEDARFVLEHPRLPFVSYPYEWGFLAHKAAALFHLDLHLQALGRGFTLTDASAYNIQFVGTRPVFIDHLSFAPYRDGEIWAGHRQFCMQFLNPLLLHTKAGVRPNAWLRGALEGIGPDEVAPLLPWLSRLSPTVFAHVVLHARLHRRTQTEGVEIGPHHLARLPRTALIGMLSGLRRYIASLAIPSRRSIWSDYVAANTYGTRDTETKKQLVRDMVARSGAAIIWDIGCNTGDHAFAALDADLPP